MIRYKGTQNFDSIIGMAADAAAAAVVSITVCRQRNKDRGQSERNSIECYFDFVRFKLNINIVHSKKTIFRMTF